MAAHDKINIKVRYAFSIIGITFGILIFLVFGFNYENWNTAIWGLLSGVAAALTMCVHVQYTQEVWQSYPHRLRFYMLTGCFIQLAGVCGFVSYLSVAIAQHQSLTAYGNGYFLTAIWCFMTWKWGFLLFYFSRAYRRMYLDIYTILPQDPKDEPNPYGSHF